jgi:hypothetical protein
MCGEFDLALDGFHMFLLHIVPIQCILCALHAADYLIHWSYGWWMELNYASRSRAFKGIDRYERQCVVCVGFVCFSFFSGCERFGVLPS